ncbi:DNA replication licensing factor MCM8 [Trachymyrmex septentrionalis]|uniref:DNA helicase MCM8 n=1 Tax=Trachymyrmex septentrionalis TaxID=34720 RepID=A0A195EYB2_9HYME|nr:DNA replication licensing factor MCM8 [Trachymyrmex septentrionalis]
MVKLFIFILDRSETNYNSDNLDIGRNADIPYYGWRLFFSDKEYKPDCIIAKQIKAMEGFIERHKELSSLCTMANFEAGMSFDVDICELYNDAEFMKEWPNFKDEIYEDPTNTLNCIKLSIHQKIFETVPDKNLQHVLNSISNLPTVKIGILNYKPIICLRDLKLNCYVYVIIFVCVLFLAKLNNKCYFIKMVTEKLISTRGCVIRVSRVKYLAQWIENKSKVPKILDVELLDDLVNICMPGDDITLTGIIKVLGVDDGTNKVQVGTPFSLYMKAITDIYKKPNLFALLVHSLCPNIYGHEIVKAGLILSLFGGNAKRMQLRDDIHILLVGDPGLGKSQMLQACARISAKGVYICGNSSTSSGLTVTLTKETGSNDFALEPGALVLADQGCCCIDEFDKMCSQHQALLESMEQQSITVAKSGIICSLPARISILAAANPIGGQYDKSKTVNENLHISQPILSRFDLIFLLLDKPNKHFDNLLCKHIMTVHTSSHTNSNEEITKLFFHNECALRKKLMLPLASEIIPQPILRTYISYAREYVKPKLSVEAATVLQNYYLKLRAKNEQFSSIPIFNRQLEAMIRLTEARAKLELRMEATESDALDVIDILRYAMIETIEDDCDVMPKLHSDGKLTNRKLKTFIKLLEKKVTADKEQIFSVKELEALAVSENILMDNLTILISKLNEEGILLKIRKDMYKFIHYTP